MGFEARCLGSNPEANSLRLGHRNNGLYHRSSERAGNDAPAGGDVKDRWRGAGKNLSVRNRAS
jgi:hypothetical protein